MDLKRCRTCFIDLDASDLFLKLDSICKNSKLTLGEKLKICVPKMDLKDSDELYICMQCSMHLETAYSFHMTCLKTEEDFQKYILQVVDNIQDSKNLQNNCVKEEEKKKIDHNMCCHTCNINFSSRNIFDLHMKVMHPVSESIYKKENEKFDKSKKIKDYEMHESRGKKTEILKDKKKAEIAKEKKEAEIVNERKKTEILRKKEKTEIVKGKEIGEILKNKKKTENTRALLQMVVLQTNIGQSLIKDSKKCKREHKEDKQIRRKHILEPLREQQRIAASRMKRSRNGRFKKLASNLSNTTQKVANVKSCSNDIRASTKIINKKQENTLHNTNNSHLKCKFCSTRFSVQGTYTRHMNRYHKDKCNHCNICQRYFIDVKQHKKKYNCHLKQIHQDSLNLTDTQYRFSQDTKFFYIESGDKYLICVVCRQRHSSETALKDHMLSLHKGGIPCKKCHQSFSASNYSIHIAIGCQKSPFFNYTTDGQCICPVCNIVETRNTKLFQHLSLHSPQDLKCNKCYNIFDTFRLYCEHIVLGCTKIKAEQPKDSTVFVDVHQKGNDPVKTPAQTSLRDDPLAADSNNKESNSLTSDKYDNQTNYSNSSGIGSCSTTVDIISDKNVKVEPTELLDQSSFALTENSLNSDLTQESRLDLQFFDEDDIIDSPELIYVVTTDKTTD